VSGTYSQTRLLKKIWNMSLWQHVQVVEFLLLCGAILILQGDLSLVTLDLCELGVEQHLDSSLLALFQDEVMGLLVEL
jgi:hypothetical protein